MEAAREELPLHLIVCVYISVFCVSVRLPTESKASVKVLNSHNPSMYNSSLYINSETETREGSRENHQRQT